MDDKQLNKKLAEKMINPFYFTDRILKIAFNTNLDSHHINHANSKLTFTPKLLETEKIYVDLIMREMTKNYARLLKGNTIKNQTVFSASFFKLDEDDEVLDGIDLYFKLNIDQKITESDIDDTNVISQLEHQNPNQKTKDSGWIFNKTNSMTILKKNNRNEWINLYEKSVKIFSSLE